MELWYVAMFLAFFTMYPPKYSCIAPELLPFSNPDNFNMVLHSVDLEWLWISLLLILQILMNVGLLKLEIANTDVEIYSVHINATVMKGIQCKIINANVSMITCPLSYLIF